MPEASATSVLSVLMGMALSAAAARTGDEETVVPLLDSGEQPGDPVRPGSPQARFIAPVLMRKRDD